MKKTIFTILLFLACTLAVSAQTRAVGVRLGGTAEVSYQHCMPSDNFLEVDAGLSYLNNFSGVHVTGIYDFVFANVDRLSIYAGPGAQMGVYNQKTDDGIATSFHLGIAGQLGAEFAFRAVPINLSLDWRPCWAFIGNSFHADSFCLGVRYRF